MNGVFVGDQARGAALVTLKEMAGHHGEFDWRSLSAAASARFGLAAVGRQSDAVYRSPAR